MNVLVLLLVAGVVAYAVLGWVQTGRRTKLGLTNAAVVAADDSEIGVPTLRSDRLGLVGRPDHLVRIDRKIIPVEQKPRARRVHDSHVMQLAAQCMLVTEVVRRTAAVRPLGPGEWVQQQVPFTRALEKRVLETMARMRVVLEAGTQPGPRWMGSRCRACGFFETCWE